LTYTPTHEKLYHHVVVEGKWFRPWSGLARPTHTPPKAVDRGVQESVSAPRLGGNAMGACQRRRPLCSGISNRRLICLKPFIHINNILTDGYKVYGPLRWSSPDMERKYTAAGIKIEDYDAAAEMAFPPVVTIDDIYRAKVGKEYHVHVLIPDEKRFLVSEALEHIKFVEPGAVEGERIEFIVDGKPLVEYAEWQVEWKKVQET